MNSAINQKIAATPADGCTSPSVPIIGSVRKVVLERNERDEQEVIEYFEWQSNKTDDHEPIRVLHLEKMKTEVVFGRKHVAWDVHATDGRWWVITNPTNLYSQIEFPSLDYLLSFHVGLIARLAARDSRKAETPHQNRFAAAWRRWEQAATAMDHASEAEDFQAIGMKCRECFLAFVRTAPEYVELSDGSPIPKRGDFKAWAELIADWAAPGEQSGDIRSHLKKVSASAWQLANWLTHTSNALAVDAQMTLDATHHVLEVFSTAVIRKESARPERCPQCASYQLQSFYSPELEIDPPYVTVCHACNWESLQMPDGDAHD
ncbi:hypothetical protein K788_0007328 (plasmid) [Paraburkholderia caribensis MBA4]|uniref:Gamma-glutamylcyclotransferase n=1 Tax=Paraburkholderia caribensis MBA4 TaxID=1323664 RepID=A0A0P0RRI1_9BURK|nr:hypothetical protein [Paraburkholderia caribensis]ALL71683.1 hypothetical protein K788_0007328 [Paraburkholderia caribensis MBA4]